MLWSLWLYNPPPPRPPVMMEHRLDAELHTAGHGFCVSCFTAAVHSLFDTKPALGRPDHFVVCSFISSFLFIINICRGGNTHSALDATVPVLGCKLRILKESAAAAEDMTHFGK